MEFALLHSNVSQQYTNDSRVILYLFEFFSHLNCACIITYEFPSLTFSVISYMLTWNIIPTKKQSGCSGKKKHAVVKYSWLQDQIDVALHLIFSQETIGRPQQHALYVRDRWINHMYWCLISNYTFISSSMLWLFYFKIIRKKVYLVQSDPKRLKTHNYSLCPHLIGVGSVHALFCKLVHIVLIRYNSLHLRSFHGRSWGGRDCGFR